MNLVMLWLVIWWLVVINSDNGVHVHTRRKVYLGNVRLMLALLLLVGKILKASVSFIIRGLLLVLQCASFRKWTPPY